MEEAKETTAEAEAQGGAAFCFEAEAGIVLSGSQCNMNLPLYLQ
jgi:hypothetical protein